MTTQVTPKFGLCMDWETSGATWGGDSSKDYQGIQAGFIVFDTSDFSEVERLKLVIKFNPDKYKWTPEAEKIHGLSQEYLAQHGVDQEEAAGELAELILKYFGPDSKVMILGHNTEFDRRFTNQLLNTIGIEFSVEKSEKCEAWIQVHHVVLDTSSTGFVTIGLFKSDLLFDKIGFDMRGHHDAMTDAEQTLQTAQALRVITSEAFATWGTTE